MSEREARRVISKEIGRRRLFKRMPAALLLAMLGVMLAGCGGAATATPAGASATVGQIETATALRPTATTLPADTTATLVASEATATPQPTPGGPTPTLVAAREWSEEEVRAILSQRVDVEKHSVGIVVGLVSPKGELVVSHGATSRQGGSPLGERTVFEIGSVSKVFTTLLLAEMVERGEVRLDQPISSLLPQGVKAPSRGGKEITLQDLATHSSGLPRLPDNLAPADQDNPYADYTVEQLYQFLSGHALSREIGAQYEYSNLGVGLLGHLLALRAGAGLEQLMKERVFGPLGMEDTTIALSEEQRGRLAQGHNAVGYATANWDLPVLAGAGAFRSTPRDMVRFVQANLRADGELGPAMLRTHEGLRDAGAPKVEVGLGWHISKEHGREIVWHNGSTGGYHSFIGFDRASGTGVVVLTNSASSVDDIGMHLLEPKYALAARPPLTLRQEVELDPAIYERYVGEYELAPEFVLTVTREGAGLFVQATGQSKIQVYPESERTFFYKVVDAQLTFEVDASGAVTGLTLHQHGQNVPGKKRK